MNPHFQSMSSSKSYSTSTSSSSSAAARTSAPDSVEGSNLLLNPLSAATKYFLRIRKGGGCRENIDFSLLELKDESISKEQD